MTSIGKNNKLMKKHGNKVSTLSLKKLFINTLKKSIWLTSIGKNNKLMKKHGNKVSI